ncbi:hypothetical protein D3C86_1309280 [compost metagenome]
MLKCGCEEIAEYEVYEDKQPHCLDCMIDAVYCREMVLVRRIDEFANTDQGKRGVCGSVRSE